VTVLYNAIKVQVHMIKYQGASGCANDYHIVQQNMSQYSAPSCDHFGRHGKWKKYLATKILAKVANWRPTELKRNLPEKLSKIG